MSHPSSRRRPRRSARLESPESRAPALRRAATPSAPRPSWWILARRSLVLLGAGIGVLRALLELLARAQAVLSP